jgi:hypothetical protein
VIGSFHRWLRPGGPVWVFDLVLPQVRPTFAGIARIISEPLPESAFMYRKWWANQSDTAIAGTSCAPSTRFSAGHSMDASSAATAR